MTSHSSTAFWHAECTTGISIDLKTEGDHKPDLPDAMPVNCPICSEEHSAVRCTEAEHLAYVAECSGAGNCQAYYHEHGCFADIDGTRCNDPDDHAWQREPASTGAEVTR